MRTTAYLFLASGIALVLTLIAGCDPALSGECEHSAEPVEVLPLVDAEDWTQSAASDDPLADHQPAQRICPASAWGDEFGTLEVSTSECNYLSVEQPLAEAIDGAPHPLAPGQDAETFTWSFPVDWYTSYIGANEVELWGFFPHMHERGTKLNVRVLDSEGQEVGCIADVPRWDFGWQLYA